MVIKTQLTVVCFDSGPSSALSTYLSWVKTLEQIRDICSTYAIALPKEPLVGTLLIAVSFSYLSVASES